MKPFSAAVAVFISGMALIFLAKFVRDGNPQDLVTAGVQFALAASNVFVGLPRNRR